MSVHDFRARYDYDCFWRQGWDRLARKLEGGRLQSKQDYIERRANRANNRISKLMRDYDKLVNTSGL